MLRLMIVFPNVLSYVLLIGLILFISTNYNGLKEAGMITYWLVITAGLAVGAVYTTFTIIKKIKQGAL